MKRIGLTADLEPAGEGRPEPRYWLKTVYADAVLRAGGLPLVLPHLEPRNATDPIAAALDTLDALVVTGGAFDVSPALYGAEPKKGLGPLKEGRTRFEAAILEGALARGMPVLGVCGGMQLLAVVRGGTLHQDIATEIPGARDHEQKTDRRTPSHPIDVAPGSQLAGILGTEGRIEVNSTHHQAVDAPGEGLVVSARADDGVIEAIEDPSARFVVGVQWHPELLAGAQPEMQRLYDALVAAA